MKILHIITRMVHGGAQLNTLMCAAEQARRGHRVTLITGVETGSEGSLLQRAAVEPIRLIKMPALVREINPLQDLRALFQIYAHLGEGYDIVHTHTSKAGLLGRMACKLRRVPAVVHTPHGHIFHGYFSPLKERFFTGLERLAARLTDRMVMLTEGELRDHLQARIAPERKFVVIPSGIDLSAFSPKQNGVPNRRVGTVLRLVEVKGVRDLVEAFSRISNRHPDWSLHVAGDGPLRAELDARVRELGMAGKIVFHGHVDPVSPFLNDLDLFVLPSHNEGMGRVVVEAFACGLPVLATRVSGIPDLVVEGETGFLVPPRDPEALAQRLDAVLSQPEILADMTRAALAKAPQYSAEVMYDRLETLYDELARKSATRFKPNSDELAKSG